MTDFPFDRRPLLADSRPTIAKVNRYIVDAGLDLGEFV